MRPSNTIIFIVLYGIILSTWRVGAVVPLVSRGADINIPSAVASIAVDPVGGKFYVYADSLYEYDTALMTQGRAAKPLATTDFKLGLSSSNVPVGSLHYQQQGENTYLFICTQNSVGIIDLKDPSWPINTIWTVPIPMQPRLISQCAMDSSQRLWVVAPSGTPGAPANMFRLTPKTSTDWTDVWQSQMNDWQIGDYQGFFGFAIAPNGFAWLLSSQSLLINLEAAGVNFPVTEIGDQVTIVVPDTVNPRVYGAFSGGVMYRTLDLDPSFVVLGSSRPDMLIADSRAGRRQMWLASCDRSGTPTTFVERLDMDSLGTASARIQFIGCPSANNVVNAAIDVTRNTVILPFCTPTDCILRLIQMYDCPSQSTCPLCSSENRYCSWCIGNTALQGASCKVSETCISPNVSITTCPTLARVSPSSSSFNGGGQVVLSGSNFDTLSSAFAAAGRNVSCSFEGTESQTTLLSSSRYSCRIPNIGIASDEISLDLSSNGVLINAVSSLNFSTYDCSSFASCSECALATHRECGWCVNDGVCRSRFDPDGNGICPSLNSPFISYDSSSSAQCGSLTSISPSNSPLKHTEVTGAPTKLTIIGSFPNVSTSDWTCDFIFPSQTFQTTATLNFQTSSVSCDIYELSSYSFVGDESEIEIQVQLRYKSSLFAANSLPFTYYDCNLSSSCGICNEITRPFCRWCMTTASCAVNTTSCTNPATSLSSCPTFTLNPPSSRGITTTSITITGGPFIDVNQYSCRFSDLNDGANPTTTTATRTSSSTLTCDAPIASVTSPFDRRFEILLQSNLYAPRTTFRYYTCTQSVSNCSTCADPLHLDCSWCIGTTSCGLTTDLGGCPTRVSGFCPTISNVSPSFGDRSGGLAVTLKASGLATSLSHECLFIGPSSSPSTIVGTSTTLINSTTATCVSPNIGNAIGEYQVTLRYTRSDTGTEVLGSIAKFNYINCVAVTECGKCTASPQCAWCPATGSCRLGGTCTTGPTLTQTSECPVIKSVTPIFSQEGVATNIDISGTSLYQPSLDTHFRCGLGPMGFVQATRKSAIGASLDVYTCRTSPSTGVSSTPFIFYSTLSSTVQYAQYLNEDQIAQNFEVVNCNATSASCDTCATNPSSQCGWCAADNTCSLSSLCSNQATWAQQKCPRIDSVEPSFGDNLLGQTISIRVSRLEMSAGTNLACKFGEFGVTQATKDLINQRVTCDVPKAPGVSANVSVSIVKANNPDLPFTTHAFDVPSDPSTNFEFVDCNAAFFSTDTCTSCIQNIIDSRCGWCVYSGACATERACRSGSPVSAFEIDGSSCATITDISPKTGPSTGNTIITITGSGFIRDSRLQCMFEDQITPTVFINSNQITCLTPKSNIKSGTISTQFSLILLKSSSLLKKNALYARKSHQLSEAKSFKRQTKAESMLTSDQYSVFAESSFGFSFVFTKSSKSNLAWVAAPVILFVVIVIIAIVVLMYLRKRHRERKLVPPDFNKYAFSANTRLLRPVAAENKDKLDALVPLLQENAYKLSLAMREVTKGSDDELLSRSLIYGAYPNGFCLDMLIHFIKTEVDTSLMEGELFRASSLACKMFTIYSKIVGIVYLWKTLARSIHQLDDAGTSEDKRAQTPNSSGSTTPPPTAGHVSMMDLGSLEVDPERLAEKLEKEVDEAVLTEVSIYQYELLLKTGRIFKKVTDSVNHVPRELRIIAKRVKEFVNSKYSNNDMDYKGVGAFFFLRFICPAVMTPQIYGILEHVPGETSQRYFVLISKTLQNLANGTLPSKKESYMAKMDDFVIQNKDTLYNFINKLVAVSEGSTDLDEDNTSEMVKLTVADDLYYSSLSFLQSHYLQNSDAIQAILRKDHDDEFADRVDSLMKAAGASNKKSNAEPPRKKKSTKNKESKEGLLSK